MTDPTTQAYAELQQAFEHYNVDLFDGQIPRCLITMQREKRAYGYYSTQRFVHRDDHTTIDEIAINPAYFGIVPLLDRKSTRLNSSHVRISYAVFCLKKKNLSFTSK